MSAWNGPVIAVLLVALGLALTVIVILRAGYDHELAARKAAEAERDAAEDKARDMWLAGFEARGSVIAAGVEVVDLTDLHHATTPADIRWRDEIGATSLASVLVPFALFVLVGFGWPWVAINGPAVWDAAVSLVGGVVQ